MFLPLSVGGKILLAPNALALPQMPARDQVTLINTVPSAIAELLNQGAIPPSVRTVNLAGEPLSTELADRLYAAGVGKVYDLYGPSEDTTYSTFTLRRAHAPATIGRPISNTQLYLLDARMQPVPVGVVGEIYLGGEGLARGYLNRAELTSERFVADPFGTPGGRLYRTGDLGKYFRDGNVGFLGRMDHQVKIRGFRIELGEIERRLREHERVAEAVVLAREDDPDQKRLVAYVVLREGGLGVGELRGHLGVTLPEYMIPSAFVFLEALPLTPNGKIDRKALPAPEMQHPEANYVAPRTPTEELLVGLWAELLKVQPIGIHDNFFDLGGHSLLATRVVARILSDLHIDIPMRTLFERPTIAGLVEAIEAANPTQSDHARTPLVPVTRDRALPLSFAQQRLWFIDQLESARTTYLVPLVLRLRGALHVETLRRVLETIVARHEVLRTLFPRLEGDPIQRIAAQAELRLSVFDLSKLPPAIRGPEADRRITEEARVPFSLADGPLIRCLLVRMDAEEHRLVVVMHHIITDGWSQGVFLQELTALYNAFSMDAPSPLPALPIQYADYAVWQREWLRGEALERQLSYWKEHLSGAPALLELPTDHPRPPVQTFQGASQHRKLSAQLTQQIKALAQREGSTLFMTLLSAFYVLLARYSGQEDIVVGTPIANRTRAEVEGLIGFFVNTLALRGDLSGDPSFRDLLDRVRRVALSAYAHQDLPFEKLVEELSPTRTLSYSPIFQAMFALQNMPNRNHAPGALQIEEMEIESVAAKFDLSLIATESASGLNLTLEYSTDLFQTDRMERMLAHFQNLLQSIVTEPQLPVSRLNLLSETERHQLLVEYNTPQIYFQPELCLHQLIQHQVAQTPEAIAVTFEDQHLTYQQLNARANQLAHYLIDQGVGPDRLVGLYVERSLEMVVGILGILKAGAAYLPLDPSYPQERIAYMLEDSQAALLLIQRSLQQNLTELPVPSFCLDTEAEILASYPTEDPETSVTPDNLAYVIYTSGSTGHPKGVLIPHYNVVRLLQATQHWFHFDVFDVWTLFHSHAFDFSVWEIFGALVYGGRLIVVPYLLSRSPEEFWELVVREGVTVLNQTPSAFYALMRAEEKSASSGSHDLRYVIFGGEALELGQLSGWLERHGEECPQLINMYGITETTVHVTYRRILKSDVEAGLGSLIGRSLPDLTLYVLDGALQPVPVGVRGELYVGGAGLARGYLKRPELTQERFIDNPFSTEAGSRLYKTGDVGCWHMDGTLEYLGRSDHQVKIRGFRIELGEIESRLREHESVREALVLAREDEPGHKRLVAYLVASEAGTAELSELRAFLKEELPEYMVPSGWVWLEAFPLTSNGKVDRKALPRPDSVQQDLGGEYVAPRTPREAKLAQVWAEVLRVERVGIFDNFFELGGDSILSLQIISRARQVGIPLRPTHIFQHQCIAELAEAATESAVIADQATVSGPVPSTPILRWFFERHLPDAGHFNQFALLEAREPVDAAILERVTAALINHHDMLRLRCLQTANGWDLSIAPEEAHPVFSRLDFSELSEAEQERRIDAEVARLHTSLDLTAGPLMRVALFDLGPDRPSVVAILIHHLCIDGVSWRILREDLEQGYRQALAGQSIALPEKTTSFPFWAERLAQRARSAALSEERDLWLSLASSPRMPLDFAQGPNTIASLRNVSVSLDEETTEVLLRRIPASHSVRLEEALITALAQTLTSWIGGDTLALHLEGHGREALFEDVDLSRTVGWFTSLFPVCLSLPSSASPEQQLGSVRDQLRAIPNRGVGYGMLRYLSEDEALMAQMAAVPEPEIGFNYLGQLEQGPDKGSLFAPRGASFSLSCSPRQSRARLLDLDCFILGGRLHMHWSFSENLHCQATIEQLAHAMLDALKRLAEADAAPMTQGYVDHDFPEMELSQESLDQILAELDL
ncbi:MAG TPA: amino acid adenylation domain-containing protein [Chthonomonadaceae bacterium]|nr:amino acid adenylation domain-containing protein [Chthonomonadaceae bacterium]